MASRAVPVRGAVVAVVIGRVALAGGGCGLLLADMVVGVQVG